MTASRSPEPISSYTSVRPHPRICAVSITDNRITGGDAVDSCVEWAATIRVRPPMSAGSISKKSCVRGMRRMYRSSANTLLTLFASATRVGRADPDSDTYRGWQDRSPAHRAVDHCLNPRAVAVARRDSAEAPAEQLRIAGAGNTNANHCRAGRTLAALCICRMPPIGRSSSCRRSAPVTRLRRIVLGRPPGTAHSRRGGTQEPSPSASGSCTVRHLRASMPRLRGKSSRRLPRRALVSASPASTGRRS